MFKRFLLLLLGGLIVLFGILATVFLTPVFPILGIPIIVIGLLLILLALLLPRYCTTGCIIISAIAILISIFLILYGLWLIVFGIFLFPPPPPLFIITALIILGFVSIFFGLLSYALSMLIAADC